MWVNKISGWRLTLKWQTLFDLNTSFGPHQYEPKAEFSNNSNAFIARAFCGISNISKSLFNLNSTSCKLIFYSLFKYLCSIYLQNKKKQSTVVHYFPWIIFLRNSINNFKLTKIRKFNYFHFYIKCEFISIWNLQYSFFDNLISVFVHTFV